MKNIILILLFLPLVSFAQLDVGVSASYQNSSLSIVNSNIINRYVSTPLQVQTQLRYNYKKFTLISDTYINISKSKEQIISFKPQMAVFDFTLRYSFTDKIHVDYQHRCIHSFYYIDEVNYLKGGHNYIKISYNIK